MFTIGLGFRQGVSAAHIEAAIRSALGALPPHARPTSTIGMKSDKIFHTPESKPLRDSITSVATLDAKSREPGLLAFCAAHQIGLRCYSRDILARLPGPSSASAMVQKHFGLAGICESAALASLPGGALLLPKTSTLGVSVAIAGVTK